MQGAGQMEKPINVPINSIPESTKIFVIIAMSAAGGVIMALTLTKSKGHVIFSLLAAGKEI